MDDKQNMLLDPTDSTEPTDAINEVSRFTESYASFTRVINALQRKYIKLEEEFTEQNRKLADANSQLSEVSERNLTVTEFLNGILHTISAGVVAVNKEGQITHVNRAAERILGIDAKQVLGKLYRDCVPPGTPAEANALRSVERACPVDSTERQIDLPDGTRLYLSVSTAIMRDNEGQPSGAVEVFQDMTKIKKMEQEFTRLNTLAAMGEMAATIAHEVRNPLSGIAGFAALLSRDIDKSDPRLRLVNNIRRGVDTLNHTITTLLDYARLEETNKTEVALCDLVQSAIGQFKQNNPKAVRRVEFSIDSILSGKERTAIVSVDPVLMKQVFCNLFTNAIESFSDGGRIEIDAHVIPKQEAALRGGERLLLGSEETLLGIGVSDNGPGIPKENLEQIFAPFFTTRTKGNGLGLAVVWKIMKAHGGNIVAENTPNGGAMFRLLLPIRIKTLDWELKA